MTQDIKLAKKYQKFKDDTIELVKGESKIEGCGFNYIGIGKFFDILNELEKYGFDIFNEKVELDDIKDCDDFAIKIYIESQCGDDKIRYIDVRIGTWNNRIFKDGYETNDPLEKFCYVSVYGEKFNDDDVDVEYYFDRKDMPKITKWLKNCLESTSPDEVVDELEKIE